MSTGHVRMPMTSMLCGIRYSCFLTLAIGDRPTITLRGDVHPVTNKRPGLCEVQSPWPFSNLPRTDIVLVKIHQTVHLKTTMPSFVGAVIMYIRQTLINSPYPFHNPNQRNAIFPMHRFNLKRRTCTDQIPPRCECIEALRPGNDNSKYRST